MNKWKKWINYKNKPPKYNMIDSIEDIKSGIHTFVFYHFKNRPEADTVFGRLP